MEQSTTRKSGEVVLESTTRKTYSIKIMLDVSKTPFHSAALVRDANTAISQNLCFFASTSYFVVLRLTLHSSIFAWRCNLCLRNVQCQFVRERFLPALGASLPTIRSRFRTIRACWR